MVLCQSVSAPRARRRIRSSIGIEIRGDDDSNGDYILTNRPESPPMLASSRRIWTPLLMILFVTSTTFPGVRVVAQETEKSVPSYYASCFEHLRGADDDNNRWLSSAEFGKFLLTQSGGTIVWFDNPPSIVTEPFTMRQDSSNSDAMDISSIDFATSTAMSIVSLFCRDVYTGLLQYVDITIEQDDCIDALETVDVNPTTGQLLPSKYPLFISTLSSVSSLTYTQQEPLPRLVQDAFDDLSIGGEIRGSRGLDYLTEFCNRVALAVRLSTPVTPPASLLVPQPMVQTFAATPLLSRANYTTCRTALIVSDANRDDWLDAAEFVVLVGKFSVVVAASAVVYDDLDPLFQTLFAFVSDPTQDAIALAGSKPGRTPTDEELLALQNLCTQIYETVADFEEKAAQPLDAGSPSATPPSSLSGVDEQACVTSLIVSDLSRNQVLDQSEFVRFVNRLSSGVVSSVTFDDLNVVLQQAYDQVVLDDGSGIDIAGAKPGQTATASQLEHLLNVCTVVQSAVTTVEQLPTPPAPTPGTSELPDDFERLCKTAMLIADTDRDDAMIPDEYVRFLNRLTYSQFSGITSFGELDPILQEGFNSVAVNGESIVITGSKPGTSPSSAETAHLQDVCLASYQAIEDYNAVLNTTPNTTAPVTPQPVRSPTWKPIAPPVLSTEPPAPTAFARRTCAQSLYEADANMDSALNQSEYLSFLNSYMSTNVKSLIDLPYVLQDNFEWIVLEDATVNVKGVVSEGAPHVMGNDVRIQWICNRTDSVVYASKQPSGKSLTFQSHCLASLSVADTNADGSFNANEYVSLINRLSVGAWNGYDLASMEAPLRAVWPVNQTNLIGDNETALCENLRSAIRKTRQDVVFVKQCQRVLFEADSDGDAHLNSTEYSPFLYHLGLVYGLTDGRLIEDLSFDSLNTGLQLNFDSIAFGEATVNISGLDPGATPEQVQSVRWICRSTKDVLHLVHSKHKSTVAVYNSFVIYNSLGITSIRLTPKSEELSDLNEAYAEFVKDYVTSTLSTSPPNLRGNRRLGLKYVVPFSEAIYQIDDSDCPTNKSDAGTCMTAFGSFYLSVVDLQDAVATSDLYSDLTQTSIDDGALQLKLEDVNQSSPLQILVSSLPLRPTASGVAPMNKPQPLQEQGNGLNITLAIGGVFLLAGFSLFVYRRQKRDKAPFDSRRKNDEDFSMPDSKAQPIYTLTEEGLIDHNSFDVPIEVMDSHGKQFIGHPEQHPNTTESTWQTTSDGQPLCFRNEQSNILQDSFECEFSSGSDDDHPAINSVMDDLRNFLDTIPDEGNEDKFENNIDGDSYDSSSVSTPPENAKGKANVVSADLEQRQEVQRAPNEFPLETLGVVEKTLRLDQSPSTEPSYVATDFPEIGQEKTDLISESAEGIKPSTSSETSMFNNFNANALACERNGAYFDATDDTDATNKMPYDTVKPCFDEKLTSSDASSIDEETLMLVGSVDEYQLSETVSSRSSNESIDQGQLLDLAVPTSAMAPLYRPRRLEERADETTSSRESRDSMEQAQRLMTSVPIEGSILNDSFFGDSEVENDYGDDSISSAAKLGPVDSVNNGSKMHASNLPLDRQDPGNSLVTSIARPGIASEASDVSSSSVDAIQTLEHESSTMADYGQKSPHRSVASIGCIAENEVVGDSNNVTAACTKTSLRTAGDEDVLEESTCSAESECDNMQEMNNHAIGSDDEDGGFEDVVAKSKLEDVENEESEDESEDASESEEESEDDSESEEMPDSEEDESIVSDGSEGSEASNEGSQEEPMQGESSSNDEADTLINSTDSANGGDLQEAQQKYRPIVEALVREVVPNEIGNIDSMMEQFFGRETELIATLKGMVGIDEDESKSDTIEDDSVEDENSEESESESIEAAEELDVEDEEESEGEASSSVEQDEEEEGAPEVDEVDQNMVVAMDEEEEEVEEDMTEGEDVTEEEEDVTEEKEDVTEEEEDVTEEEEDVTEEEELDEAANVIEVEEEEEEISEEIEEEVTEVEEDEMEEEVEEEESTEEENDDEEGTDEEEEEESVESDYDATEGTEEEKNCPAEVSEDNSDSDESESDEDV